jgi:hypothetical protein
MYKISVEAFTPPVPSKKNWQHFCLIRSKKYYNHYRIAGVCRVPGAHGKVQITHGALPCVAHGKEHMANSFTVNPIFTHGETLP